LDNKVFHILVILEDSVYIFINTVDNHQLNYLPHVTQSRSKW